MTHHSVLTDLGLCQLSKICHLKYNSLSQKTYITVLWPLMDRTVLRVSWDAVSGCAFCPVQLLVTLWTIAHQPPLSMGFSRQEHRTGLPFPSPGIFWTQGSNPLLHFRQILYLLYHWSFPLFLGYNPQFGWKNFSCSFLDQPIKFLLTQKVHLKYKCIQG